MSHCESHDIVEPIMEPAPHIKATTPNDRERWATVQAEHGETLYCPYCGQGLEYE